MTVWVGLLALGLGMGASLFLPVPQNLKTNFDAGQSLYALGEFEGAILEYSKIVKFKSRAVRTDSVLVRFGRDLELPVVAAAWYQLGNAYKKSGQHGEAVKAYQQVVDITGVIEDFRSLVQFQIAETRFLQKEYTEAAEEYKKYVRLFPNSEVAGKAFFYSGWSEFNLKEYETAIATLQEMLEKYPEDRYAPDAQFRIASAHYEMGMYELAIDKAQGVLNNFPSSPVIAQATYLKANALDQMERDEEAIAAYREVRGLYDRMFELLRGSFREGKNVDFENYRQLFETSSLRVAEIFRKTNQFEDAYKELIAAQETAEERFYKAKVQMRIGDNYMEWGRIVPERLDDAWTAYNQVIELYADTPYPPNAQYQKGEARYFAANYEAARNDYLKVLGDYPDSETGLRAASLYSAGWAAERLGSPEQALTSYAQAVESFPRSEQAPLCLLRMARLYYEQEKISEATDAYKAITDNYQEGLHAADAYYGLGILYRDEERFDEAIVAFSKVDRGARETYIAALIEAANIHISEGRPDEGRTLLNQLLAGVTGDPTLEARAHFQMAQLDLNNKNYVDAANRYTKVLEEYPNSEVIRDSRYGRALAYHWTGRYDRALIDYKWLLNNKLPAAMKLKVEFSMALSYSAQGSDDEAKELLRDVIDSGDESLARSARLQLISMAEKQDPQEAIGIYEEMLAGITSNEEKERVLIRLASAYFRLDQYQQSIDAAQQLIDLAVNAESISNALFVQGNSYFKAGEYPKAIATYGKIIEAYPQIGWAKNAQFQIGVCYQKIGSLEVLPAMSQAFEIYYNTYPEDERAVFAYYYDAWARYRLGKWRDASRVFNELAVKHPRSRQASEGLFRAGDAIFNMTKRGSAEREGQLQEAMGYYQTIIDKYPRSDYMDDALYNMAWCLIELKRTEEAVPIFEEIVEKFSNARYGPRSQFTLGDYYYGLKDYTNAAASYEKFLELFPEERLAGKAYDRQDRGLPRKATVLLGHLAEIDAYNLYAQGEKLFDQKQYDEAVVIFEEVQQKYPESDQAVNAAVNIGAAYMAQEDYRQAGAAFQKVVEIYGENPKFSPQVDFSRQQLETMQEARVL